MLKTAASLTVRRLLAHNLASDQRSSICPPTNMLMNTCYRCASRWWSTSLTLRRPLWQAVPITAGHAGTGDLQDIAIVSTKDMVCANR